MGESPGHPAALSDHDLLAACRVRRGRTGGPGGSHRNKVETAVHLTHLPTGIEGQADERRSQEENRKKALSRLRLNLAVEHRMVTPGPAMGALPEPSDRWWRRRRPDGTVSCNPRHPEFPVLLAEVLDLVAMMNFDVRRSAMYLACTTSQLVKFLALEPRALAWVNEGRRQRGQRALK